MEAIGMGAEWWEFTASFDEDTPDVAAVLSKHKTDILACTPDWDDVRISTKPGMCSLTPYPATRDEVRDLYVARGERDLDDDLGPDWDLQDLGPDFMEDLPRGQGFYEIEYNGDKPIAVKFCGYSCD
jgi:hypothetical protein